MSDKLLAHFENELAFIQESAGEFAKQHPAAASRLQLSGNTVDDPLVARLLSGFAYLNARVQQKLTDDFPELTDAMLDTLYPHYLRPIPSFNIVQFEPDPQLDAITRIDSGTLLESDAFQGQTCRFTTSYPVDICPFTVDSAALLPRPFIAPGSNEISGAAAVLKLSLRTLSDDLSFNDLSLEQLRFFLRGQPQHIYPLYELLLTKTLKVVIANGEADPYPKYLEADIIQQVGFEADEALLPYPNSSFTGYRLLTEYFAFPEKFQFLDIKGLQDAITEDYSNTLNLYFYLKEGDSELEHQVNAKLFALGCTPSVNLFPQTADPIPLNHTEYQYHVVPDARRTEAMEIYSIDNVGATDAEGNYTPYKRFYGIQHSQSGDGTQGFWFGKRRTIVEGEHRNEQATEMDISLVDLDFNPHQVSNQTLDLQLICSNRNLPKKLPSGGGQPLLQIVDGDAPTERISCVVTPTATLRPPQRERSYWRLISHLNLNHLSLSNGGGSTDALKEILRLYDFRDSAGTRNMIEAIQSLITKPITAPIQIEDTVALCRGTEVHVELDPMMLAGTSPLLFASVLERFLGLYCSINSFTRLIATLSGKDGELKRWPPRAGEKALV
ncbi:type VI secretion system baseplate subunit TssF [Maricurvus nonylphenolicus]|uniref:type VI secretion system baseplate subunit TssF n=1 Tax=Maricurvus nonylphenolicus TaxID=1008307 RepID=UPI0036F30DA3